MSNSTLNTALGSQQTGALITQPVIAASLALQLTTLVTTTSGSFRFPLITEDPSAAWTAENAEIQASEATGDEIVVTPRKVAGLSIVSNELASDSSPEAAKVIGDGLARDIARKIDEAFFGPAPANENLQPGGLEYLADKASATVEDPSDIDAFIDALAAAEALGATIDSFVTSPSVASILAKLKVSTDSNLPLFGTGATNGISRNVLGVPLFVSPYVDGSTVWALNKASIFSVVREDVTLDIDKSAYFSSDRTGIRATMRVGFGFVNPKTVGKIKPLA